tara:strand:+ start:1644 stop:1829 length:186 start_codon:yes stop_codon:yes gene_type:complete
MTNFRIIFVDGREDLVVPTPFNYGNHWVVFKYLSELLRTRCIHEDEIETIKPTHLPITEVA